MDRDNLFAFVRANDPKGAISKKLIGWHGEEKYEATKWAWNGSGYECFYFCHKSFTSLQAPNQHLESPVRKFLSSTTPTSPVYACGNPQS